MAWQFGWRSLSVLFVIPESDKRVWGGREKTRTRAYMPSMLTARERMSRRCMSKPGNGWAVENGPSPGDKTVGRQRLEPV